MMPQLVFMFYPAQVFWLVVSFGILFLAMRFWLLPPVADILQKREEKIKNILRQADKLTALSERIGKSYQQYIDDANQYSARVLQTAHDEVAINYANQEEELLQILKSDTAEAEQALQQEKKHVLGHIEEITLGFVQTVLKALYHTKADEKTLQKEISTLVTEEDKNV